MWEWINVVAQVLYFPVGAWVVWRMWLAWQVRHRGGPVGKADSRLEGALGVLLLLGGVQVLSTEEGSPSALPLAIVIGCVVMGTVGVALGLRWLLWGK